MSGERWQVSGDCMHDFESGWVLVLEWHFLIRKNKKDMRNTVQEGFPLDGSGVKPLPWFAYHSCCF